MAAKARDAFLKYNFGEDQDWFKFVQTQDFGGAADRSKAELILRQRYFKLMVGESFFTYCRHPRALHPDFIDYTLEWRLWNCPRPVFRKRCAIHPYCDSTTLLLYSPVKKGSRQTPGGYYIMGLLWVPCLVGRFCQVSSCWSYHDSLNDSKWRSLLLFIL